jgi:hypothetical protein
MISEIQTINRLLASVNVLEVNTRAKEADVLEYYTTQYVNPIRDSFDIAESFCVKAKLIEINRSHLRLSDLGRTYLSLGDKKAGAYILEPNQKQKDFLSRKVFLISETLDLIKKILYYFNKSREGRFQLAKEKTKTLKDQNLISLLLQLGILIDSGEFIELSEQYAGFLEKFIANTLLVVTPEMFEKSENERKELAEIAEMYVLQTECNRLKNTGAIKQSKGIDYVALRNIAAGYDIASFNDQNSKTHDKFIEVKAGNSTPINFFLSKNEFESAKRLKDEYFIYYVGIKNKKPKEIFIFNDPVKNIMKDPRFIINVDTYEISEK